MVQVIARAFLIVALGVALGLLSNAVLPKGIPLITPPKKAPSANEFIPLEKAHDLWSDGAAVFFDARDPEDFNAGHIAQAVNLPAERFEEEYPKVAPMLTPESAIVIYCDGTECELSHRLASQLRPLGYTNVHLLFNGWTTWHTAGFPVQTNATQ